MNATKITTAEKLIANGGDCAGVSCSDCPYGKERKWCSPDTRTERVEWFKNYLTREEKAEQEPVEEISDQEPDKPEYYKGHRFDALDVAAEWNLDLHSAMVVEYIYRAGKDSTSQVRDLKKARDFLDRKIKLIGG